MNIALIAPIERNIECLNKQTGIVGFPRLYEDEAIRCFQSWRRHGGWLKDIPIYTLCSTGNSISRDTEAKLANLGVTHVDAYAEETKGYSSGFLTLPYCGMFFQEISPIKEDITVRIDLDMVLLKPLGEWLFEKIENATVIGQYDIDSIKDQRFSLNGVLPFDTGFMISHRKNHFYRSWHRMCNSTEVLESDEWKSIRKLMGDYYLEEFAVDYMFNRKLANIMPVQKYQHGEGYASVDTFTDEQMDMLYFRHEHIYANNRFPWGYDSTRERLKYIRRMQGMHKTV